ncbi:MAG: hypothetical protein ACP5QY_13355, partial [Candidatus Hydrogenedens sp.]
GTLSVKRSDSDKNFTKKVLRELSKKKATLSLFLKDVQIHYDAITETVVIHVNPSDNNALSCLAKEETKRYIFETVTELGFPGKQIQIVHREIKQNESSVQSPRRGLLNDLVPQELAQEIKQDPKIQSILNRFMGRIVKVSVMKETEEESLPGEEITEEGLDEEELDID